MARTVNLRVSLQDGDLVKRALMALGAEGETALKRIERGGKPASVGLKAVDTAAKETRSSLEGLAARAGAGGSILRALGPAGLAAGAGIGAIVIAIGAVMSRAREAAGAFDTLEDSASRLGVGTEYLQGLRFSVGQAGGDIERTEAALFNLNTVMGDVARGGGAEAAATFKALGISVTDSEGKLKSIERFLPELADGYKKLGSASEQASVAQDIFGRGNQAFARVLADGSDGLRRQIELAREMGAVVDAELVRKGADAKDKLEALAMVVSAQLNGAVIDAAPLIIKMGEAFAGLAHWLGMTADAWKELPDQRVATLADTLGKLKSELEGLQQVRTGVEEGWLAKQLGLTPDLSEIDQRIAGVTAKIAEYQAAIEGKNYLSFEGRRGAGAGVGGNSEMAGFSQAIQDTIDKLKEQEEQAKRTGRELAIYNALLGVENATAEERAAISAQAVKTFDAEEARRKQEEQSRKAVADAARKQRDAERALEEVKRDGVRLTDEVATAEEKRAKALSEINVLLQANAISEETAARARAKVEDNFLDDRTDFGSGFERAFRDIQKDAMDTGAAVEDFIGNSFSNSEAALEAFAKTGKLSFKDLINSMIADLARLAVQMAVSGFVSALGAALGPAAPAGVAPGTNGLGFLNYGGPRAGGGDVWPGNFYRVNEGGDSEWFAPRVPGTIFSANSMRAMGTSGDRPGFSFSPITQVDARGADSGIYARIEAMLAARDQEWERMLPALLSKHRAHSSV